MTPKQKEVLVAEVEDYLRENKNYWPTHELAGYVVDIVEMNLNESARLGDTCRVCGACKRNRPLVGECPTCH